MRMYKISGYGTDPLEEAKIFRQQRNHTPEAEAIRQQFNLDPVPSYVHEIYNPPSRGKMHRCKQCWQRVDTTDNGFKDASTPYPHAADCPYFGRF